MLMCRNRYNFQKLTPIKDADISVYEEAINFVFKNDDIKNVAITGSYSSGKSSVLETYKYKHSDKRFIHLSLTHFRTPDQEKLEKEDIPVKESVLEGKILNQLIHQIPAKNIPQTDFRVKKSIHKKDLVFMTIIFCLLIVSILFLILTKKISSYITSLSSNMIKRILIPLSSQYAVLFAIIIGIGCFVFIIYSIIKLQKNKNIFRKINLQGNEIEIFANQDDSYFDKYLNEVIYLFDNVDADVIVFEDIDRFNVSQIFERLREVNLLVNIKRKNKRKNEVKPLRFFYLLRDDIFISKDRTKFFDYIIPIVHIVDSSNSYNQFLRLLCEGNLVERFDKSFLQGLSLYIDDMRILKNIYNEFVVYFTRLNTIELDYNKMMALIVYKNLFPSDFSDLQVARGFVYEVLCVQKEQLIDKCLEKLKNEREVLISRIELAKKETLKSQEELNYVYEAKIDRLPEDYLGRLTEEGKKIKEQYDAECFERKQAIQDNLDGNLTKLEEEITILDREISSTRLKSLRLLINRENINSVFSVTHKNEVGDENKFNQIKRSEYFPLLKYLIRNGFIDETYTDYMTYFYEDSMSTSDKIFLRRVTDRRGAAYTYPLKKPKKVIDSPVLRQVEFEQEETLNFDLLECLLINDANPKYELYLNTLINQIKTSRNFDFISLYYDTGKEYKKLIIKINSLWTDFFSTVLKENLLPENQIRRFSIDSLYFSDEESIKSININNCLVQYISDSSDYLGIEQPDIQKLISGFKLIGVKFVSINYDISDRTLFDEVYQHNLYELSYENIVLMLNKKYQIDNTYDITHRNFTMIQKQSDSPLAKYILDNMESYIDILLENCNGEINDDEDDAIYLLNNQDIDLVKKEKYINFLITPIHDIVNITDKKLWMTIFNGGKLFFSENNVVNYFNVYGIDSTLINYVNKVTVKMDFSNISNEFGEDVAEQLFDSILICNELITSKYLKILTDLGFVFNTFDEEGISDEKFEVLINNKILCMDKDGLKYVRNKYPQYISAFIKQNLDEYVNILTSENLRINEILEILKWEFVDDEKKIKLLSLTSESISIISEKYSDKVSSYIVTHNLNADDEPLLSDCGLYKCISEICKQSAMLC